MFYISNMLGEKKNKAKARGEPSCEQRKQALWLVNFLVKLWLDQGLTGCHVKWTLATPHRSKLELISFSLHLTDSTVWKLLKKQFLMYK